MNGVASTPSNHSPNRHRLPAAGIGVPEATSRTPKSEALPQARIRLSAAVEEAARRFERGEFEAAQRLCADLLAIDPRNPKVLQVLGMIAYRHGEHAAAARYMRRALALDRKNALYHSNLGGALQALDRPLGAVVRYRIALSLEPEMAEAHYNLGNALRNLGRLPEAIESYSQAIAFRPNLAQAHNNLADVFRSQGRLVEAVEGYKRAIACQPPVSEAFTNLGAMLQLDNLLDGSLACHRRAVALTPERAEAHYNLGSVLFAMGDAEGAMAAYDGALALKPGYADAHFGRSLVCLFTGEFAVGWKEYSSRWQSTHFDTIWRSDPTPVWNGESLRHGCVFLWREQGVGDEIMFASLVPELLRRGIRCVLGCDRRLRPLFERSFPAVRVIDGDDFRSSSSDTSGQEEIVAHLPIGSLPGLFRLDLASFARTQSPYLLADGVLREKFRERYGAGRLRVGVAWHTRNKSTGKRRSIELEAFAPIFIQDGDGSASTKHWISLQYGSYDAIEAEVKAAALPITVDRKVDQLDEMDVFAAQIAALDLVITIDNSTAHLAGALGVPTWVLLPFAPDWRWMERREDSPWYPTVRLFRQPRRGDWESVLMKVGEALAALN